MNGSRQKSVRAKFFRDIPGADWTDRMYAIAMALTDPELSDGAFRLFVLRAIFADTGKAQPKTGPAASQFDRELLDAGYAVDSETCTRLATMSKVLAAMAGRQRR